MAVTPISGLSAFPAAPAAGGSNASIGNLFSGLLGNASSGDLSGAQGQADALALKVATGQSMELHEAVIAMEQANLSLHLAVQVRNKILEAYQEVVRMQV